MNILHATRNISTTRVWKWLTSKFNKVRHASYFWTFVLCGLLVAFFLICKLVPCVPECLIPWLREDSESRGLKVDLLAYIAALATVMIPIYLFIAEQKVGVGKIGSLALLRYANFRTVVFLLITQVTLMLFADVGKKTDYFTVLLIIASLVTVVYALRKVLQVLLQEKSNGEILKPIVRNVVAACLDAAIQDRYKRDDIYRSIKNSSYTDIFVTIDESEYSKFSVKSTREGRIASINVVSIDEAVEKLFGVKANEIVGDVSSDLSQDKPKVIIELNFLMGRGLVDVGDDICSIYILKDRGKRDGKIEQLKSCIIKNVKISNESDKPIALVTDWLDEIERKIDETRSIDGVAALNQALDWYEMIVDELDSYISEKLKFSIEDAEAILGPWQVDGVSQVFRRTHQIIDEALRNESKRGNVDRFNAVYDFAYRKALNNRYLMATVRFRRWLRLAVYLSVETSEIEEEVFDRVVDSYATYIGGSLYEIKEQGYGHDHDSLDTVSIYLDDTRNMLLYAIKNRNTTDNKIKSERSKKLFEKISKVLIRYSHQGLGYRRYSLPDKIDQKLGNVLLLVAVYAKYKNQDEQCTALFNRINTWSPEYLTERTLTCYDNNLIDKWNINTFDLEADGQVHDVPDLNGGLREIWLDGVKNKIDDLYVRKNFQTVGLENTLFFTGGMTEFKNTPFHEYENNINEDLLKAIKECCKIRWDWENNQLAKAPLDQNKIDEFHKKAENSFRQQSIMTKILPKSKLVLHRSIEEGAKGYRQYGINTVFGKEAFIKDWHVSVMVDNVASDIGRQAAVAEDSEIIKKLTKKSNQIKIEEIGDKIGAVKDEWIVILQNIDIWEIPWNLEELCDKRNDRTNVYIKGIKQRLPAFELYDNNMNDKRIIFIRKSTLGSLEYKASDSGNLDFSIKSFYDDVELVNNLIEQKPDWLQEKSTTNDEMRRYLNTRVWLYLNRIFRYSSSGDEEVFVCDMANV